MPSNWCCALQSNGISIRRVSALSVKSFRLATGGDRLDDPRREEAQRNKPPHRTTIESLALGEFVDGPHFA
ncbi:MAG: hypothetical protein IVW54_22930 [Candidatus Binataceae bacterium]|nr:hypothetical protein [Candidatus Binataceae bacterium]